MRVWKNGYGKGEKQNSELENEKYDETGYLCSGIARTSVIKIKVKKES